MTLYRKDAQRFKGGIRPVAWILGAFVTPPQDEQMHWCVTCFERTLCIDSQVSGYPLH